MLKKIYGQNIGLVRNSKPIMIENPEFLGDNPSLFLLDVVQALAADTGAVAVSGGQGFWGPTP